MKAFIQVYFELVGCVIATYNNVVSYCNSVYYIL
jgi:hypothetical protein